MGNAQQWISRGEVWSKSRLQAGKEVCFLSSRQQQQAAYSFLPLWL
jgi:hypothetical protein